MQTNHSSVREKGLLNFTRAALLCVVALVSLRGAAATDTVQASRGEIAIPTYPWWPAVKHPYFRGTDKVNIYPYPMLDNLSRQKEPRTWRTVVLENEYLRVTFLPELGGKIHEVIDKTSGQPMFYVNNVVKPGLIGQCGAWTSGGIEWNTGPQGHTVGAMQPMDVEILPPAADGSRSVAVGEVERIYRTHWTVVVTLRPGRSFLEERVRIYNATETVRPYYFWNCTAVPNTPGFRFIYPMTLGSDHGATKFFSWPIDNGKDLTRGTNYQDASSIFAWHCDQDFFGSYDDGVDRGVVAHANHHQLPGKKAWTWGQGGFGRMHQADLTDNDGAYNEVQTGPMLTQAEVGRLDPHEAVSWQEWWYPVRGIGGFTFANRDLAANASLADGKLRLRLMGTGTWPAVKVLVTKDGKSRGDASCRISPREPADLTLDLAGANEPLEVEVKTEKQVLARFRVPLNLPDRKPPVKEDAPQTAHEYVRAGWQDFLFARISEAETHFRKALEKDAKSAGARGGLAFVKLDSDPLAAATEARAGLAVDPDDGMARYALAVAEYRLGDESGALDDAWKASLAPVTAVAGRALAAKMLARRDHWTATIQALSEPGPWQNDPVCRNRLAFAFIQNGNPKRAAQLARQNLAVDPMDAFARSLLWLANAEVKSEGLSELVRGQAESVLGLVAEYAELGHEEAARKILDEFYFSGRQNEANDPLLFYWRAYLTERIQPKTDAAANELKQAGSLVSTGVFPYRMETIPVLRRALELNPNDGKAALYLGHLLFALGRHAEGRALWQRAADRGAEPAVAYRALGMASLNLDSDQATAAKLLTKAHDLDTQDAIIARDLARVLFAQADKADAGERKQALVGQARETLKAAFAAGKGRSDFVSLLARAQNRLGQFTETAQLLDAVRVTIWEGAREAHDLFEEAHLALGKTQLEAGRAAEALAEFNRALEYPENLATGKLENAREAHIHYLRGNALMALDQKPAAIEAWRKAADERDSGDAKQQEARKKAKEALDKAQQ